MRYFYKRAFLPLILSFISSFCINGPNVVSSSEASEIITDHLFRRLLACNVPIGGFEEDYPGQDPLEHTATSQAMNSIFAIILINFETQCNGFYYTAKSVDQCTTAIDIMPCNMLDNLWSIEAGWGGHSLYYFCTSNLKNNALYEPPYLEGSSPLHNNPCFESEDDED